MKRAIERKSHGVGAVLIALPGAHDARAAAEMVAAARIRWRQAPISRVSARKPRSIFTAAAAARERGVVLCGGLFAGVHKRRGGNSAGRDAQCGGGVGGEGAD